TTFRVVSAAASHLRRDVHSPYDAGWPGRTARVGDAVVASIGFDTASMTPAARFQAWRESLGPSVDIEAVGDGCEPRVTSTSWVLNDVFCNELGLSPIRYRWRPCRDGQYLLIRLYKEGHSHGIFDDAAFRTRPG